MNTSQTTFFFKGPENFLNPLSANPTKLSNTLKGIFLRVRSLVVSNSRSKTKGFRFESGCYLCAEVSSL